MSTEFNNKLRGFLIIEPNQGSKNLFTDFFKQNNLESSNTIVSTVREALYLITELGFQFNCCMVSVDYNDEFNGYEALNIFKNYHPSITLIASGVVNKKAYIHLEKYQVHEFFKKDFTSEKILFNQIFFQKFAKNLHSNNKLYLKIFVDSETKDRVKIKEFLELHQINHKIEMIDVDVKRELAEKFKVLAIPTIIRENPHPTLHFLGEFLYEKEVLALIS